MVMRGAIFGWGLWKPFFTGFIRLNGLRLKVAAKVQRKK